MVGGSFPQFSCYWGAPATAKCGVGFLIRKSSVWTASPLTWSINSPCHRHPQTGRLHAFNLTEADSDLLQRLPLLGWTSLSAHVGMQDIPTCFKNDSNHIDFVYVNNLVLPLFDTYWHGSRAGLADHVPLLFQTGWGISAQHVLRSRDYGDIPLDHGNVLISRRHAVLSSSFSVALQGGDVDYALRLWNVYAESFLHDIYFQLDSSSVLKRGRGSVRLDNYELWPQTRGGGIAPLYARQLWKHICCMVEIEKRPAGQVAVRAWKNAQSVFEFLCDEDYSEARFLLHGRCCASSDSRLKNLFENGIAKQQSFAKRARIKDWKCKLQNSVRAQHAWIKKQSRCAPDMRFRGLDGKRTANLHEQFRAVKHAWSAVTNIFRHGEPDHDVFFQQYGHFLPTVDVDLPAITGDILRQAIASMPLSSPGLGAWKVGDLRLLVLYAPWVFDSLAVLLPPLSGPADGRVSSICGYTTLISPRTMKLRTGP